MNFVYFIILNKDGKNPIKYIYNIHDNILEEIPDKTLITDKNKIVEEMENQKKLEPNNFYTLLYFKNIEPTFQSDHNDHELIVESLKDIKNYIINMIVLTRLIPKLLIIIPKPTINIDVLMLSPILSEIFTEQP